MKKKRNHKRGNEEKMTILKSKERNRKNRRKKGKRKLKQTKI